MNHLEYDLIDVADSPAWIAYQDALVALATARMLVEWNEARAEQMAVQVALEVNT